MLTINLISIVFLWNVPTQIGLCCYFGQDKSRSILVAHIISSSIFMILMAPLIPYKKNKKKKSYQHSATLFFGCDLTCSPSSMSCLSTTKRPYQVCSTCPCMRPDIESYIIQRPYMHKGLIINSYMFRLYKV